MKENLKSKGQVSLNGLLMSQLPARRSGELQRRSGPRTLGMPQLCWLPQGQCTEGGDCSDDQCLGITRRGLLIQGGGLRLPIHPQLSSAERPACLAVLGSETSLREVQ